MCIHLLKCWKKQLSNVLNMFLKTRCYVNYITSLSLGTAIIFVVLFTVLALGSGLEFNMKESCEMGKARVDIKSNCIKLCQK